MQGVDYSGTILILKMDKGVPLPFEISRKTNAVKGVISVENRVPSPNLRKTGPPCASMGGNVIWATKKTLPSTMG